MIGRSYFQHDEMALAFAARVGRLGGQATARWEDYKADGFVSDVVWGEWVVRWDVPNERLAELVGQDVARSMFAAELDRSAQGGLRGLLPTERGE